MLASGNRGFWAFTGPHHQPIRVESRARIDSTNTTSFRQARPWACLKSTLVCSAPATSTRLDTPDMLPVYWGQSKEPCESLLA